MRFLRSVNGACVFLTFYPSPILDFILRRGCGNLFTSGVIRFHVIISTLFRCVGRCLLFAITSYRSSCVITSHKLSRSRYRAVSPVYPWRSVVWYSVFPTISPSYCPGCRRMFWYLCILMLLLGWFVVFPFWSISPFSFRCLVCVV